MRSHILPVLLAASLFVFGCAPDSKAGVRVDAPALAGPSSAQATPDTLKTATIGAIPNLHVAGNILFSGQPAPADFSALQTEGVTLVVNLRPDTEMGGFDEAAAADASGMAYVSVPWNGPAQLTDEIFGQTRDALREAEGKTLLHCSSANRVGAVWIPFRVLDQGVDLEQAVREAREIGMRTDDYERIARDYVARNR